MHHDGHKVSVGNCIQCNRSKCKFNLSFVSLCDINTKHHSDTCCKLTSNEMTTYIADYIIKHNLNENDDSEPSKKRALLSPQSSKPTVSRQSSTPVNESTASKRQRVEVTPPPSSQAQGKSVSIILIAIITL